MAPAAAVGPVNRENKKITFDQHVPSFIPSKILPPITINETKVRFQKEKGNTRNHEKLSKIT